ncbi:MAG TPA: hypothetical protein VJT73_16110, partial [Polyangiaceae bacterium]|nr:hypothetical protein [Polyangiaceae bacterium]
MISISHAAVADRIAVIALDAPGQLPPLVEADRLGADLSARGHRVLGSADVMARISMGDQGAGADWAAQVIQSLDAARSALTRLDRGFAQSLVRTIANDIAHRGGGAGGAEVLVEWCMLERQLALTASDAGGAERWLAEAVALGPEVELDPLRHPEEERDGFARKRARLRAE